MKFPHAQGIPPLVLILTIVVNYVNISCRKDLPPPSNWSAPNDRLISTAGPLYTREQIEKVLAKGVMGVALFTEDCFADVAMQGWALQDVVTILREALTAGTYKNSQWCKQSPTGPIAPCDAYVVPRLEVENGRRRRENFYVKFAIAANGQMLLIFSCHP